MACMKETMFVQRFLNLLFCHHQSISWNFFHALLVSLPLHKTFVFIQPQFPFGVTSTWNLITVAKNVFTSQNFAIYSQQLQEFLANFMNSLCTQHFKCTNWGQSSYLFTFWELVCLKLPPSLLFRISLSTQNKRNRKCHIIQMRIGKQSMMIIIGIINSEDTKGEPSDFNKLYISLTLLLQSC